MGIPWKQWSDIAVLFGAVVTSLVLWPSSLGLSGDNEKDTYANFFEEILPSDGRLSLSRTGAPLEVMFIDSKALLIAKGGKGTLDPHACNPRATAHQAKQAVWGVGVTRTDVHEDGGRTQTPYPIHTHGCPTGHIESRPSASPQLADGERDATRGRGGVHRQAP